MRGRARTLILSLALVVAAIFFYKSRSAKETAPTPPPAIVFSAPTVTPKASAKKPPKKAERAIDLVDATLADGGAASAGSIEGEVVSKATGEGVANAALSIRQGDDRFTTLRTDAKGAFVFLPPAEGTYAIVDIMAKGYLRRGAWDDRVVRVDARAGKRVTGLVFRLDPYVEIVVVARSEDKKPIAGARVRAEAEDGNANAFEGASRATTDDKGEATIAVASEAFVAVDANGYESARGFVDQRALQEKRVVVELAAAKSPPGKIAGKVVDDKGAPVADARVLATADDERASPDRSRRGVRSAATDASGVFSFDDMDAPSYALVASAPKLADSPSLHVDTGKTDVVLALGGATALRGRVRDKASGAPVTSFSVVVRKKLGGVERGASRVESFVGADGTFEIDALARGAYLVAVAAHGFAPTSDRVVDLPDPPAQAPEIVFDLGSGARVTGTVVEREGHAPIAGASVVVSGASSGDVLVDDTTLTDAHGAFSIAGVGAGVLSLDVEARGHDGRIVSGLRASDGGDIGPIEIDLAKTEPGEEPKTELTGIGAVLKGKGDALVIVDVVDGGGAKAAGLGKDDAIVAVDGETVVSIGFDEAIQRIRGPEGSTVDLLVQKGGAGAPTLVAVVRKRIRA